MSTMSKMAASDTFIIELLIPFWRGNQMSLPILYKVEYRENDMWRFQGNQRKTTGKTKETWEKSLTADSLKSVFSEFKNFTNSILNLMFYFFASL